MREGIGRVFFRANEVGFQPLTNHQALVLKILASWQAGEKEAPLKVWEPTRAPLLLAARWHDDGKRLRFRIVKDEQSNKLTYSFRGHRFDIAPEVHDPYARALIRQHHDYATDSVVNAASEFSDAKGTRFAEDLYLLMMADQLEAEVAVRIFEGKAGEVRPFVEFELENPGEEREAEAFRLDPWPFQEEALELEFKAYFHPYRGEGAAEVEGWGKALAEALAEGRVPGGFRLETRRVRLMPRREEADKALPKTPEAFYALFPGRDGGPMKPTEFQQAVWEAVASGHPAHLLLAPTGTGKTEAAAFPALALGMRLVFALPARSLVDDLEDRFARYLQYLASHSGRTYRLLVDTGHRQVRRAFHPDGKEDVLKTRHLYKADVILTTLDKLLYRYFGYADGTKGYVFPRRIHDQKSLFIFDEAHVYEATAWANFRRLVAALHQAGIAYLIMTATMPEAYRKALDPFLEGVLAHPKVNRPYRTFRYLPDGDLLTLARQHRGKRVLVVVEQVRRAAEIYRALKKEAGNGVFLYHGRQAESVRRRVFTEVKARDEKALPYLLITTRAIEVGVDLDAEVLITELCPPENLLQRMGRVNRRGSAKGEIYVVGRPEEYPEWLAPLPDGYGSVLKTLHGKALGESDEAILKRTIARPAWTDPRAETLFEMLHEYVYQAELLSEPLWRRGFIATRGWEPTVILRSGEDAVEVPVGLLIGGKDNRVTASVKERLYPNRERGREQVEVPLRSGELYRKHVVVDYPFPYDPEEGFVEVPKVFQPLFHPDPQHVRLLYDAPKTTFAAESNGAIVDTDRLSGDRHKAVLWYLADSAQIKSPDTDPETEEA